MSTMTPLEQAIDLVHGQVRRAAREAEYLAKHGKRPFVWWRKPLDTELAGELAVAEWPGLGLSTKLRWRLLAEGGIPETVPFDRYREWLLNAVGTFPLIRTSGPAHPGTNPHPLRRQRAA